ncbi:MAG: hypothetical protein RIQ81_1927 [Pseudomonadota bacterium]
MVLATAAVSSLNKWGKSNGRQFDLHWAGQEPSLSLIRQFLPGVTTHDINEPGTIPEQLDACLDLQGNLRSLKLTRNLGRRGRLAVFRSDKKYASRLLMISVSRILGRSELSLRINRWLTNFDGTRQTGSQWSIAADAMERLLAGLKDGQDFPDVDGPKPRPRLFCPTKSELLDPTTAWVAVAPGAAHAAKKAPAGLFASTLKSLVGLLPADRASRTGLVLLGAGQEKADCAELMSLLEGSPLLPAWPGPVLDLSGKTDLCGTVPVLNACQAVLSNDSSLAHIAESLGKPAFVFFGPTAEAFGFAPHLDQSRAYSVALGCRPCSKHGKAACRYGDHLCFTSIPHIQASRDLARILMENMS